MRALEPGEKTTITYGNGRELEIQALSFRQQRELAKLEDQPPTSADDALDKIEKMLRMCLPNKSEEEFSALLDTLNLGLAQELMQAINEADTLSEDDKKKSE